MAGGINGKQDNAKNVSLSGLAKISLLDCQGMYSGAVLSSARIIERTLLKKLVHELCTSTRCVCTFVLSSTPKGKKKRHQ